MTRLRAALAGQEALFPTAYHLPSAVVLARIQKASENLYHVNIKPSQLVIPGAAICEAMAISDPRKDPPGRHAPKPDLSSCSRTCLDQIRKWLKTCGSEHDCLEVPSATRPEAAPYPTRLIDVGTSASPLLRLCDGKDITGTQPYMTLSHCWGKAKFFTLVTSNLADLKVAIPLDTLSKTHQEAIRLTRSLDVRYL